MNARIAAGGILFLALAVPAPVRAWPNLDVTSTEVVSTDPPRWRTTFTIYESGPTIPPPPYGCGWAYFWVKPQGIDGVPTLYECAATAPWTCQVLATANGPVLLFWPDGSAGEAFHVNSFSIVTDRAAPCVRVEFECVILMGAPAAPIEACLSTDLPVPAQAASWGQLKVLYR